MKAHCLFEQSGTFKNEFIKLGIAAYDYDIKNEFNQTDFLIDLFEQIELAYNGKPSIFDMFNQEDIILAFFPCTRFETKIQLWFRGKAYPQQNYSDKEKLLYSLKLHKELSENYELITKLALIAYEKKLKLIIENPASNPHYLTLFWPLEPAIIDKNRRENGDYQKKPTQYFFINFSPKNNMILEPIETVEKRTHDKAKAKDGLSRQTIRSMIHPQYANRFIRQYIL